MLFYSIDKWTKTLALETVNSPTLNVLIITLIVAGAGFALFWFRGHYKIVYGSAEACVGALVGVYAIYRVNWIPVDTSVQLQVLGGLYIIVRGLDNIEKGIEDTWIAPTWARFFKVRSSTKKKEDMDGTR